MVNGDMSHELPSLQDIQKALIEFDSFSELLHFSERAESSVDEHDLKTIEAPLRDQEEHFAERNANERPARPTRNLNFIIDTSAFLQGMGNVKRWFDAAYATAQIRESQGNFAEIVKLKCFIPLNTLIELHNYKRNSSIEGPNAVRALKFIDQVLVDGGIVSHGDKLDSDQEVLISYDVEIEERSSSFPTWKTALRYAAKNNRLHEIDSGSKFLIRSSVAKAFMGKRTEGSWRVITESQDRNCVNYFGLNCLNVNEAELFLFRGFDVTRAQVQEPGALFNCQNDIYDNSNIMSRIDTSLYSYGVRDPNAVNDISGSDAGTAGGAIIEDFNTISYAPRPKGNVWMPPKEDKKRRKATKKRGPRRPE